MKHVLDNSPSGFGIDSLPVRSVLAALMIWGVVGQSGPLHAAQIPVDNVQRTEAVSFENDILPILRKNCLACHSASEKQGELVLESPQGMLKGGDTGPAAISGKGLESLIVKLASHQGNPVMPPVGNDVAARNLTSAELGLLKLWIDQGAKGSGGIDALSPKKWQPLPPGIHPVQAIALTDDGQYVAASRANRIELYHVPTGTRLAQLVDPGLSQFAPQSPATADTKVVEGGREVIGGVAHRDLVQSLAFNVDGDLLASGGFREVKLWRRPRDVVRQNLALGGAGTTVAVSADRTWIAAAVADFSIRLFNASTGQPGPTLTGHTGMVTSLRFNDDNTHLLSGSVDQSVRVWNVIDGSLVNRVETPAPVNAIELVPLSAVSAEQPSPVQVLVTGHADNLLRVWDSPISIRPSTTNSLANCTIVAASEQREMLAQVDEGGTVRVISLFEGAGTPLGKQLATWKLTGKVTAIAFVRLAETAAPTLEAPAQGYALLTGSQDGSLRLWDLSKQSLIQEWKGDGVVVRRLAGASDGKRLSVGYENGAIWQWDVAALLAFDPTKVTEDAVATEGATPEGTGGEGEAKSPEPRQPEPMTKFEGITQPITAMTYLPNGQSLIVTAQDGNLRGYNTESGQQAFATNHGAAVHDLALSPDAQVIATAGENGTVRLWNMSGGGFGAQTLSGFSGPVLHVAFSMDGSKLIGGGGGEKPAIQVHELQQGVLLERFTSERIPMGAMEPTLGLVLQPLTAGADPKQSPSQFLVITKGSIEQRQLSSIRQIAGHNGAVTSLVAFPGRAEQFLSGSVDNTIRLWSVGNGQQIQTFNHGGAVQAIAVRPDGERVASVSDNHTGRLFNINGQQLAEMRGDVRLKIAQVRAQQQLNAANGRLNAAKQRLDQAEKDVPIKTTAEKTLADGLAKANQDVTEKQAAVEKTLAEKLDAEKLAVEASSNAKTALAMKEAAELEVKVTAAAMQVAQARMQRLTQAANSAPENEQLKQLMTAAQQELATCQEKSQAASAAAPAPAKAAQEMAVLANTAAQKVNAVQKPFNDATQALKVSQANQNLLSQQLALATTELKVAQELVPVLKEGVTRAEEAQKQSQESVELANKSVQEGDLGLRSIAFSPDGTTLITAGDYANIHSWDAETGAAMGAFAGHTAGVKGIRFLDGETLVSISDDQSCRIWELNPEWKLERTIGNVDDFNTIVHRVTAVDFNADSSQLIVAGGVPSRSGELQVFHVADGSRLLYLPQAHQDVIYSARFSPDGKRVASVGADKYLRTFDVATSQQLRRFEGHTSYVLGVDWKGDGQLLATSAADQTVKIWEAETGDQQRTIENQFNKHVTGVQFVGESNSIITCCGDKRIRMFDATNGGLQRNYSETATWIHCVSITPDSAIVVTGDASGAITVWNGQNSQLLRTLKTE